MTDFRVKRIVVACDAACENLLAIRIATRLAARWDATIRAVFVEDQDLIRAAAHPLARHVGLGGNALLDVEALMLHFDAQADRIRAALEEGARRLGLPWSFGIMREAPTAQALALTEGDMLVAETSSRPFAGQWRAASRWSGTALQDYGTVLLLGSGTEWHDGVVALIQGANGAARRTITAAAGIADKFGAPLRILTTAGAAPAEAIHAWVTEVAPRQSACPITPIRAEAGAITAAIDRAELLVFESKAAADRGVAIEDVVKMARNDILLVG
jgi:hypothetical protein